MDTQKTQAKISALIPVGMRVSDIVELYRGYRHGLEATGCDFEVIFVLDGRKPDIAATLERLQREDPALQIISLTRSFGEATALMAAFERSTGEIIVTLPAYHQITPEGISALLAGLESADMTVAHRWPRAGSRAEKFRRQAFHALLGPITGARFRDLGCGARAFRREVLDEITLYGDQHRFLPVLAVRQGFTVAEVDVAQSSQDINPQGYRLRDYLHRALDIFTVFFLVRFTKKPLRFFGMVGALMFVLGVLLITYVVIERLFFGVGLAERPALLLSSLLAVLGLQLLALGLLGELMIFTHARDIKEYQVAEVIQRQATTPPDPEPGRQPVSTAQRAHSASEPSEFERSHQPDKLLGH